MSCFDGNLKGPGQDNEVYKVALRSWWSWRQEQNHLDGQRVGSTQAGRGVVDHMVENSPELDSFNQAAHRRNLLYATVPASHKCVYMLPKAAPTNSCSTE